MTLRTVTLLGALLLAPAAAYGQQAELRGTVLQLAESWARGDAEELAAHVAGEGLSLELDEGPMGPLGGRQAGAMLRRFFDGHQSLDVRLESARLTGGEPARAFAELTWSVRPEGTTVAERARVFIGLVREDDRWKVTQIRLLR